MRQLIVGSVYVANERSKIWYNLQIEYLRKTTSEFLHLVFLNGESFDHEFNSSEIIGTSKHTGFISDSVKNRQIAQKENHYLGMQSLLNAFKSSDSDFYLILDSDCFPIRENWIDDLKKGMFVKNKKFAAPIRSENFDLFPHPSALFFTRDTLNQNWFDLSTGESANLFGDFVNEVGCRLPLSQCFPLIRTNAVNMHPIFSGIYGDIFYHHGCGSRSKTFLPRGVGESLNQRDDWNIENLLFQQLVADSGKFIEKLTKLYQ